MLRARTNAVTTGQKNIRDSLATLSTRQRQVLQGVIWGLNSEQMAHRYGISHRTVEIHRAHILHRLGALNAADVTRVAITHGFDFGPDPWAEPGGCDPQKALSVESGDTDQADITNAHSAPDLYVNDKQPKVRVIGLQGRAFEARLHWINQWALIEQEMPYDPWSTRLLNQADSHFDAILVHGEDAKRMAGILREFRLTLPGKLMIALLGTSSSTERSLLYRAGADSVYDLCSDWEVLVAWLTSALTRQSSFQYFTGKPSGHSLVARVISNCHFTATELAILSALETNAGRVVAYADLAKVAGSRLGSCTRKSLQVRISRLKTKLAGHPKIQNASGEGYTISKHDLDEAIKFWTLRQPAVGDGHRDH